MSKTNRIFFYVVIGCIALCGESSASEKAWKPPRGGVVRDGKAAISIAHAVWSSMNPDLRVGDDEAWQKGMSVSLKNGIWQVSEKPPSLQELGGGLEIDIAKRDGRVVGIYLTQ